MKPGAEYMATSKDAKHDMGDAYNGAAAEGEAGFGQEPTASQNFELGIRRDYKVLPRSRPRMTYNAAL